MKIDENTENQMNNNIDTTEIKAELRNLMVLMYILPDTKVEGLDMFRQETGRGGMRELLNKRMQEVSKLFPALVIEAQEEADDEIVRLMETEDGLHQSEEVDDLELRYTKVEAEKMDWEFNSARSVVAGIWSVADEAQKRHERMATRLALVDKLVREGKETESITDSIVERVIAGEAAFDVELKDFSIDKALVIKKEREIALKNNASYFRKILEDKAVLLRDFSYKAERMQAGKIEMDAAFVALVIKLANKTKDWCDKRMKMPRTKMVNGLEVKVNPTYSWRAVAALYNEALDTLVALGVFKQAFYKTEFNSTVPCSFFLKKTAEDMVEVKSGQDWAEELRSMYYEVDDGTSRTSVRTSND